MSGAPSPEIVPAVVVGAGLAGLAAATRLASRGLSPVVLEAGPRAGGCVASEAVDGYLFEGGPNSLRGACSAIAALAEGVGLTGARVAADPEAKARWLWLPSGRVALPSGPGGLLTTRALSPRARLRLLTEPFRRPWRAPVAATSLADFLGDRLGAEALEHLGAPFTTGIFAGDPEGIGVEALPPLEAAARAGGLLRGMKAMRAAGTGTGLWTFSGGLGQLTDALAARLDLRLGAPVIDFSLEDGVFHVKMGGSGAGVTLRTRRLVLAAPPAQVGGWLAQLPGVRAEDTAWLTGLPMASVASVSLGLRSADFADVPSGFGMLVARASPLPPVLGVVFASGLFPGRAPEGRVALTAICGGTRHPDAVDLSDEALIAGVRAALEAAFGLRPEAPLEAHRVMRWRGAIPQVPPGHRERLATLVSRLPPGLALAGAGLGGVSLEAVATSGLAAADRVSP